MEKRYRFRIYPNSKQEALIHKCFGCARFIYNHFLAKQMRLYEAEGRYLGLHDTAAELPALKRAPGYEWLTEAPAETLSYALCDLDNAFKSFFKRVKKGNVAPGFPKFKSKKSSGQSYRCKNRLATPPKVSPAIEVGEKAVKLPKLGWIQCHVSRTIEGRILNASVIQSPSGKYYVSLYCTEYSPESLPKQGAAVGLHLGITHLIVTSGGEKMENKRGLEKAGKKLKRLKRSLSRKTSGGKNREKARIRYAKEFEKITNAKKDCLHKATTRLVRDYDVICVRDEQVGERFKNPVFSKYLADANWGELVRQLTYKCDWYGKALVKVSKISPSARLCSVCGDKNAALKPYQHRWVCPKCGETHDRQINAAKNVLSAGLALRR